jgi:EAL and modified HD-GYP domain-containing signal transduction protein
MFSLLDAILGRPLAEVLKDMPLASDVKDALLGEEGRLHDVYHYVIAYEQADWAKFSACAAKLGADESALPPLYMDALAWATQNLRGGALKK